MRRSLPIERTTTSPELTPTRICTCTPWARRSETAIDRAEIPRPRDEDPHALLKRAATKRWVVYCKPPFAGPDQIRAYLARYTHRIAFSNDRLVSLHEGQVTFRWKDRAHGNAPRVTTLEAETFLRRFLLHVVPHRFVRIRHYGWLANSARKRLLPMGRKVLGLLAPVACTLPPVEPDTWEATLLRLTGKDVTRCPCCGAGEFLIVAIGGITAANLAPLVRAGANFLAVIGGIWSHREGPAAGVRAINAAIKTARD